MRNRKWLHVSMVLVLLLSLVSPLTISKTHAQNKLSQVSLTETENGITLSWEASLPQNEEITSYQLSKNGQVTKIEPTVQNVNGDIKQYSYEDTEIESNTIYTYEITAVTSSENLLTSEKVVFNSGEPQQENGEKTEQEEAGEPTEAAKTPETQDSVKASTTPETQELVEPTEPPAVEATKEPVVTNIKVSTNNGNIPWEFDFSIIGVSENVTYVEYYGYLDDEGYFVDFDKETKNLELPIGTYELNTYNSSTDEEITAEFKVESERDYLTNPIEILLDDEKLIIKKELYVDGVTEKSISISWEEPWDETDFDKYRVYLDNKAVETITDPYSTTYTYTDLLQETAYQLKVDIFYKDGTIETIEAEAVTTAPPAGEKVTFKDENLKTAVADALKIYHRDIHVDDMKRLTSFDASYLEIKDLTGLEQATNLVDLMLSGNEIKDIAPIKNLEQLVYLDLDVNQISSIEILANLENLDSVYVAYNELEDIKVLLELPNLTYATVFGNPSLDFTKGSEDMEVIKELYLNGVYVEWSDFEHEIQVTDVTESTVEVGFNFSEVVDNITKYIIYVNGDQVGETPASKPFYKLTGLAPLTDLDISVEGVDEDGFIWGNAYTYVSTPPTPSGELVQFADPALEDAVRDALRINSRDIVESDLTILTSLDATDRGITDLTGLEQAVHLEELTLDSNEITNLEALISLSNLAYLSAINNDISDITPLKNLANLQMLTLDWNNIEDIGALSELTNLLFVSLQNNKIKDISALENVNIEYLNLGYNEITDISSLLTLPNLVFVLILNNALDLTPGSETLSIIKELEEKEVLVLYEYVDISIDRVSDSEIELSWKPVTTDDFEDFTYMVFVNGEMVIEETKDTSYLLRDLTPDTEYTIEIMGYDENNEDRFILGTTLVTTEAAVDEPGEEPGEETDPENGETPEEQPGDDQDEVTTPGKNTENGNTPKETNDKNQDKKNDNKKNDDKKLPKTATDSYNILLFGLLLLGAGIIAFTATRKKQAIK